MPASPDPDVDPELEPVDVPPSLGRVVEEGRGSLPFALVHGEALVACASWALGEAGVTPVDLGTGWAGLAEAGEPFVLHDALCPMTPAPFIAACVARAVLTDRVVVGTHPVTDTVKRVEGGRVGGTVDRETLQQVCSPVVLPARVVAAVALAEQEGGGPPDADFAALVAWLAARVDVEPAPAPPAARRVAGEDDVRLLEVLTDPAR